MVESRGSDASDERLDREFSNRQMLIIDDAAMMPSGQQVVDRTALLQFDERWRVVLSEAVWRME
jgi:DNA replication protein DnaC